MEYEDFRQLTIVELKKVSPDSDTQEMSCSITAVNFIENALNNHEENLLQDSARKLTDELYKKIYGSLALELAKTYRDLTSEDSHENKKAIEGIRNLKERYSHFHNQIALNKN